MQQAFKELAEPGGFDITLDITEPGGYWDRWTEVDLGITAWTHRPLGTMVLPLAYIADEEGVPVPWNETRWVDDEFTEKLRQAEKTLDVEARREIMSDIEDIMQERGPIGNPYWRKVWNIDPFASSRTWWRIPPTTICCMRYGRHRNRRLAVVDPASWDRVDASSCHHGAP